MRVLILGYGRAGKRWAKTCLDRGYSVYCYDPAVTKYPPEIIPISGNLDFHDADLVLQSADFAIICTPPDKHLDNIEALLNVGITDILCEKPLCSIGELERARNTLAKEHVTVAYNYPYHDLIREEDHSFLDGSTFKLTCEQSRIVPEWGLLLDHCSHDLSIAQWFMGDRAYVETAYQQTASGMERWFITVANKDNENKFIIEETVFESRQVPRRAILESWSKNGSKFGSFTADPKMFERLLDAFLGGMRNSGSALITQRLIEEAYAKANLESV
jgi:predicted dehydrogenase